MAEESEDQGDTKKAKGKAPAHDDSDGEEVEASEVEEDDDDEGEEDEPKLKYARLTRDLGPMYRNGDATSTFLVAGDKMVGLVQGGR